MVEQVFYYRLPYRRTKAILSNYNPYFHHELMNILWMMLQNIHFTPKGFEEINEMVDESIRQRCEIVELTQQHFDQRYRQDEVAGLKLYNTLYRLAYHLIDKEVEVLPRVSILKHISTNPYGFYFTLLPNIDKRRGR